MPFEGDTTPDGWYTQDVAGSGFPAPDVYKFALLVRIGQGGTWRFVGSSITTISLGANDPNLSQMYFRVNDNRPNDNTGSFIVTIVELGSSPACCPNQNTPAYIPEAWVKTGKVKPPTKKPATTPCAGKTPDGKQQGFSFDVYCFSSYSRTIPIEACTREEALQLAMTFVSSPC